jgi:ABC-type sugar transport system ATPase subunit
MDFFTIAGLTKHYGGVTALAGVDLSVREGEVHSIVGENGAGKSTFLKIVSGIVRPDSGDVHFRGARITEADPLRLFSLGISAAFQETSLFDNLSVAENLFLGGLHRHRGPAIDWKAAAEEARRSLALFGMEELDPGQPCGEVSPEARQVLEILKAIKPNTRLVSLDEPTASLTREKILLLFSLIQRLKAGGATFLYVSHHLDEVLAISDRITVFRDGRKVGTLERAEATEARLHEMMVGRAITNRRRPRGAAAEGPAAQALLTVSGLGDGACVHDVSFQLNAGEILGFAGLIGAGRSETAQLIFGLRQKTSGAVTLAGQDISRITPGEAIRLGIAYLPEERRQTGIFLDQGLGVNTTIGRLERLRKGAVIDFRLERELTRGMLERLGVKYGVLSQTALSLSGGNQQKLLLGKCLFAEPRLLILDEPTKGIDVGSKEEIYELISSLAAAGMAVLLISSEVGEICMLSDRVLVMAGGSIIGGFTGEHINERDITTCYLTGGRRHDN